MKDVKAQIKRLRQVKDLKLRYIFHYSYYIDVIYEDGAEQDIILKTCNYIVAARAIESARKMVELAKGEEI
jgi:hypothetical protein